MVALLSQVPVHRVLSQLVEKACRTGEMSTSVRLDRQVLPEVFEASSGEDADFYWGLMKDAQQQGFIDIELKRAKSACAEYERSPKISLKGRSLAEWRVLVGLPPEKQSYREQWKAALASALNAPADVAAALENYLIEIEGRSAVDVVGGLNRLLALRSEPLWLREASSRAFWGMSKVLDNRAEMVARLCGADECPFPSAPLHLNVSLPAGEVAGVLFIENVTTYERLAAAARPETAGLVLVYGAGARATAKRLVTRQGASLFYAMSQGFAPAKVAAFEAFLFDASPLPAFCFGDLDFSGMRILRGLRENFPALVAWEPGYARLLARLQAGEGHAPAAAEKSGQTDPGTTGCRYADETLLPAMRSANLFVDQE